MKTKRLFGVVCALSGFVLNSVVTTQVPQVNADCQDEPCNAPPCCNGDVNGDGSIDIADAISILSYLFAQGGEPAAITGAGCPRCDSCCPLTTPPATGQTLCYDQAGDPVDCNTTACPGQDGYYQAGAPLEDRFEDNGDGTVADRRTGLMWQRETAPIGWVSWQEALQYCEDMELADYTDWRLPNRRELESLIDLRQDGPLIDPVFSAESWWYWTSTNVDFLTRGAWRVDFGYGVVMGNNKTELYCVRAVRGGL